MCAKADIPADHTLQEYYLSKHKDESKAAYEEGREKVKKLKESSKKKKGGERIKVTVEEKAVELGKPVCPVEWLYVHGIFPHRGNHSLNEMV